MKANFTPFGPPGAGGPATADTFRPTIIPQAQNAVAFRAVANPAAAPACAGGNGGSAQHAEPQVTLQRDGDRITKIQIKCACGQVIELECGY